MTSIEWLGFHLNSKLFDKVSSEEWEEINDIFKLAHKKHKQEIIQAWEDGDHAYFYSKVSESKEDFVNGEQYYNEKFNKIL